MTDTTDRAAGEELVERVARAIFDVRSKGVLFFGNRTPDTLFASHRSGYMDEARAAIRACGGEKS